MKNYLIINLVWRERGYPREVFWSSKAAKFCDRISATRQAVEEARQHHGVHRLRASIFSA